MNTMLFIWSAFISGAVNTMPSYSENLGKARNEISAAENGGDVQPRQ
jgi:hypothetical protein